MKNDAFERQVKHLFEHEEMALNTEELWSNIEDRVDGKKKKRRFFFWLFFGAGLLALGAYFVLPSTPPAHSELAAQPPSSVGEWEAEPPITPKEEASIPTLSTTDTADPEKAPMKAEKTQSTTLVKKGVERKVVVPPISVTTTEITNQSSAVAMAEQREEKDEIPTLGQTEVVPQQALSLLKMRPATALLGPPLRPDFKMLLYKEFKQPDPQEEKAKKSRKIKPRRSWKHAIDLYAGPDATLRHVKARSDFFGGTLQQYRENDEKSLGGYHLGFQYKLYHNRGWMLVGGLEYRQVDERFRLFEEEEETQVVNNGVVSVVVNAQGDTIRQNLGNKTITRITTYERVAYNRYRSLNATLGTGYKNRVGKWRIEWVGGVDINLSASMKGTIRDEVGNIVKIDTKSGFNAILNQGTYRSQIGMAVWGSASFARTFGNGMTLFATPYLRRQLGSLTAADYELEHRHTTLGLRLGGRIYITRSKDKK